MDRPTDAPADAPLFASTRSFVITSRLQRDGGIGAVVEAHAFTMVLDSEHRQAIVGANGAGTIHALEPFGGAFRFARPVQFELPASCPGSAVTYSDLRFLIDASGALTGSGQGQARVVLGDVASTVEVSMSLAGVPDAETPRLTVVGDAADPFAPFTVHSSEPLRPGAAITLRAASGEAIELPAGGNPATFVTLFQKPPRVLRYATQYSFFIGGEITDFAGNSQTAIAAGAFTTRARPPLAAEDGFEGVTATTFGGVRVLSGAGTPTISGANSLYIPPVSSGTTQPPLALRLSVSPGDTSIRFSYRIVPGAAGFTGGALFTVGSEDGMVTAPALPADPGTPTTPAGMIDGAQVSLGPILTATFGLPHDVADEVVLTRTQRIFMICGAPIPTIPGIIIDDLRVE